ncbi:hypothetical protein HJG60_011793 [Phyllostomus discolor]|uniref:Uncharacterized protein n=1 Tax=Phyllostomus discolor TaxID=89673 RepID=A0A833ZE21_9CHIR|nr:hypothetical protein HJG60_011793 [Phyllostomus discolor]
MYRVLTAGLCAREIILCERLLTIISLPEPFPTVFQPMQSAKKSERSRAAGKAVPRSVPVHRPHVCTETVLRDPPPTSELQVSKVARYKSHTEKVHRVSIYRQQTIGNQNLKTFSFMATSKKM